MKHSLEYKMNKMENEMQRQQTEIRDLNDRISDLVQLVQEKQEQILNLEHNVNLQDAQIAQLKQYVDD